MTLVTYKANLMALVVFEYLGTANWGVEENSCADFFTKVQCGFDNRILWLISSKFIFLFHKLTFCACLQTLAKSWGCAVYGG